MGLALALLDTGATKEALRTPNGFVKEKEERIPALEFL